MSATGVFVTLLLMTIVSVAIQVESKVLHKCIPGDKHKEYPSREDNLHACHRYRHFSCCTPQVTEEIQSDKQRIGNFSWNLCGTLSPQCHQYFRKLECFYQCEPYLGFWWNSDRFAGIFKVPICGHFCDKWFEACKEDLTCARNWLTDFDYGKGWVNKCRKNSQCRKFSETFQNGKDMCETMWGDSFVFSKKNCVKIDFKGQTPNGKLVRAYHAQKKNSDNISKVKLVGGDLLICYCFMYS